MSRSKQLQVAGSKTLQDAGFKQVARALKVDPEYLESVNRLAEVLSNLGTPLGTPGEDLPRIVGRLGKIAYLLEGPDATYSNELTATTSQQVLSFKSGRLAFRSISVLNTGSQNAFLVFDVPTSYEHPQTVYTLYTTRTLNINFMEKASAMTFYTQTGTTTLEVFISLKRPREFTDSE